MSDHSITSLIEKLEEAEVGDQDLSLEVNLALEGGEAVPKMTNYTMEPCWAIRRPNAAYVGGFENGPNYPVTQSLDAALELTERIWPHVMWRVGHDPDDGSFKAQIVTAQKPGDPPAVHTNAATAPLALCAAILRAKSEARV